MTRQRAAIPEGYILVEKKRLDALAFLHSEVHHAGEELRGIDTGEVFRTLTCGEAQALADVFAAADDQDTHDHIIGEHALGDEYPEDAHHQQFLDAMKEAGADD